MPKTAIFYSAAIPQHKMCGRKELLLLTEDVVSCGAELGA